VASRVDTAEATRDWALAELERARLKYKSEINGVNTTVASLEAQLQQSRYYLSQGTRAVARVGARHRGDRISWKSEQSDDV
jgi:hypothetical protein